MVRKRLVEASLGNLLSPVKKSPQKLTLVFQEKEGPLMLSYTEEHSRQELGKFTPISGSLQLFLLDMVFPLVSYCSLLSKTWVSAQHYEKITFIRIAKQSYIYHKELILIKVMYTVLTIAKFYTRVLT